MDIGGWASGTGFEHQSMFLPPRLQQTLRKKREAVILLRWNSENRPMPDAGSMAEPFSPFEDRAVPLDAIPLSLSYRPFPLAFHVPDDPEPPPGMVRYHFMDPWGKLPERAQPVEHSAIDCQWRDNGMNKVERRRTSSEYAYSIQWRLALHGRGWRFMEDGGMGRLLSTRQN
jgi:hypothetical protein